VKELTVHAMGVKFAVYNSLVVIVMLQLMDAESSYEVETSSLRRHLQDMEDDHRLKELSLHTALDEARETGDQLSDERRRLEHSLDEAGTRLTESRLRLSAAEGCVSALQSQLTQVSSVSSFISSTNRYTHTHTALLDFVRDYPGEQAPER